MSSHHEANKMLRVLGGAERLKYTVRICLPDDRVIEFQCDDYPRVMFYDQSRTLWLCREGYESKPIMEWVHGSVLLVEENPK